ncbi:MAG: hypothetical protein PHC62_00380 [Candidatus Izemoplasmatales bacterium]|nr:hypothetical protein [Candidatus Izemoplasmatales bacterium]
MEPIMIGREDGQNHIDNMTQQLMFVVNDEERPKEKMRLVCDTIQKELTELFPRFRCLDVMITENTDSEFFGTRIYPFFNDSNKIDGVLFNPETVLQPFDKFYLEIDDKLFDPMIGLCALDITNIIVEEVNNYTGVKPIEEFINQLNYFVYEKDDTFDQSSYDKCKALFEFVMFETMRYNNSIFCKEFGGYVTNGVEDALLQIQKAIPEMDTKVGDFKCLLLQWYLNIYRSLDKDRSTIIMLKKSVSYSTSKLFKRKLSLVISNIEGAFWNFVDTYATESTKPGFFTKIKLDGLKSIEDDLYEYKMRIRNIETQNDALLLMRQINSRMGILDAYLMENDDLSDKERKRWESVFDKYSKLREDLSEKSVYIRKMYGLFVDYNALQQMSQNNTTMNTYY